MLLAFNELHLYTGPLSFTLMEFAIFYVLYKNPREFNKSISHHAAKDVKVYKVFAVAMSAALLSLVAYLFLFLIPIVHLSIFIVVLFIVAIILELLTTWVPLTDDRKFHPHAILSNTAAFLMPVITIGLLVSGHLKGSALVLAYIGLSIMIGLVIIFFTVPKARKMYLVYQSVYIVAFLLTVVLIPFST